MTPGETINKWTFLAESPDRPRYGIFRCKCGNVREVNMNTVIKGKSKGCKKCQRNNTGVPTKIHTKLYQAWYRARSRCYHESNPSYKNYKEHGITMCDEWLNDPESFIVWAYNNGWKPGLSLDRIDNDGPYAPWNCRWATNKQQMRNTRQNILFEHDGETKCMMEWCEIFGIPHYLAYNRYRRGITDFDTVFFVGNLSRRW